MARLFIDVATRYKEQDCLKNIRRVNIIKLNKFPVIPNMNIIKPIHSFIIVFNHCNVEIIDNVVVTIKNKRKLIIIFE
jgi:hypothetical protein